MSQCKAELRKLNDSAEISFGIVTDVHYADKDMRINRSYREALAKLHECVETFNRSRLAFAVMLGDFIDKAPDRASELEYLRAIRQAFARYAGDKHFVIGNHDLARLSKPEFLANCAPYGKIPGFRRRSKSGWRAIWRTRRRRRRSCSRIKICMTNRVITASRTPRRFEKYCNGREMFSR